MQKGVASPFVVNQSYIHRCHMSTNQKDNFRSLDNAMQHALGRASILHFDDRQLP